MPYTKLFEPGRIGALELRNRIVMPAMGCSLAEVTGEPGPRMIKYYADRARGGAGLIITEITRVDDETGVGTPNQLSVTNTHMIAQLSRLAEAVHAYDTKIFVQLHHPGNQTPSRLIGGKQPVSASDVTCKVIGEQPRALTTEEVEGMVKKFVTGAVILTAVTVGVLFLMGIRPYVVMTGSMEPAIPVLSVCFVDRNVPLSDIRVGEVIAFRVGENMLVTHRVAAIQADGYLTKGDANNTEDSALVTQEDYVGKTVAVFPGIGAVMVFLHSTKGRIVAVTGILVLILLSFIPQQEPEDAAPEDPPDKKA